MPRAVQLLGHGVAISHPTPSNPALQAQTEFGRQTPWLEQLRWHLVAALHASPVHPGEQAHSPLWRSHAPWPEHGSLLLPTPAELLHHRKHVKKALRQTGHQG